jgi:hypothetical protein
MTSELCGPSPSNRSDGYQRRLPENLLVELLHDPDPIVRKESCRASGGTTRLDPLPPLVIAVGRLTADAWCQRRLPQSARLPMRTTRRRGQSSRAGHRTCEPGGASRPGYDYEAAGLDKHHPNGDPCTTYALDDGSRTENVRRRRHDADFAQANEGSTVSTGPVHDANATKRVPGRAMRRLSAKRWERQTPTASWGRPGGSRRVHSGLSGPFGARPDRCVEPR